jgi:formiminotetrahydrofolate cyclodeaminase
LGRLANVSINLGSLKDRDFFCPPMQTEADTIEQTACRREKELLDAVNQD